MNSGELSLPEEGAGSVPAADGNLFDTPLIQTTVEGALREIEGAMDVDAELGKTLARIRQQMLAMEALSSVGQKLRHAARLLWLLGQARAEVYSDGSRSLVMRIQTAEDLLCACLADALRKRGGDLESCMMDVMSQSFDDLDEKPESPQEVPLVPDLPVLMSVNPRSLPPSDEPPPRLGRRARETGKGHPAAAQ